MVFEGRTARDGLGLACLAFMAIVGAGGAAATPDGVLLGAPSAAGLLGAVWILLLAWRLRGESSSLGLGLAPFVIGLPFVQWIPGIKAWTGPPLWAPLLGVLLLLSWKRLEGPLARRALLPCMLAVYGLAAWRVQGQVGPEGDEPHYLMVADSLLRDGDVSLEQDYAARRYEAFYRKGELSAHYRVRGKHGEIYSLHAVGLSLLLVPAYALGGYAGASFFMALLLGLLVHQLRGLVDAWLGQPSPAGAVAWLVGLSPPLLHYAGLIFTEVPAALLLTVALRLADAPARLRGLRLLGLVGAIAFLPWLNVRYAALAALALLYALGMRPAPRVSALLAASGALSGLALAVYHRALYGFFDPRRVYGGQPELAVSQLPEGLAGLLFDQEFGLLVYAPVLVLAAPGLVLLWRSRPRAGLVALALVVSVLLVSGSWHMWRGGWNPPARFLVPIVPVLAVGLASCLRHGVGPAAALLAGWSLWAGIAGASEPRLVHRDRDGTAPLYRAYSGAEEWTRLLPGYVLADPDRHRLAAVWCLALGAAALAALRKPRPSAAGMALTSVAAIAFAGCASALSHSATGGRDAVRVLGRPAVELPRLRGFAEAPARWRPEALAWGPAYEPHRHPQGAPVGERLELPAGTYRFLVLGESLGEGEPELLIARDRVTGPAARRALHRVAGGLAAPVTFDRAGAIDLALQGGPALIVKELRLEPSTSDR